MGQQGYICYLYRSILVLKLISGYSDLGVATSLDSLKCSNTVPVCIGYLPVIMALRVGEQIGDT